MPTKNWARRRVRWGGFSLLASTLALSATALPASAASSPHLGALAAKSPDRQVEVIAQLRPGASAEDGRALVRSHGGRVTRDLHIINGLAARLRARDAVTLGRDGRVAALSLNASVKPRAVDIKRLATSYNHSIASPTAWNRKGATGKGVGVAVVDTGIAGGLPDFRVSQTDTRSRVVASVVTNPNATDAKDGYGHGTHVAGIIAGNANNRASTDARFGKYIGVAPNADLISIKADDGQGNATVLDAIYGIQFAVDHKATYNIRVLNLSLESTQAQSYKTDPLAAAVESAWLQGIVVVAAAGNRGTAPDAVSYAPGNDPYIISVGAVDDRGTNGASDDVPTSWSSRGVTQDGFSKPEILAPAARIVSNLAPGSAFVQMCPSCIVDDEYIRAGGTSMAAPMVAGAVAVMLENNPRLTPDQVKSILMSTARTLPEAGKEVDLSKATGGTSSTNVNAGLTPNTLVDGATGAIDYTRSSWSRSSWSTAPTDLVAGWARSSWSCDCSLTSTGSIDPTRSSWSRSSWSTSWSL